MKTQFLPFLEKSKCLASPDLHYRKTGITLNKKQLPLRQDIHPPVCHNPYHSQLSQNHFTHVNNLCEHWVDI